MGRRPLIVLLASALLCGCGGGKTGAERAAPAPPKLDPAHLPALPREFVAVQRGKSAVLVRVDGTVIGRLDGFLVEEGVPVLPDLVRAGSGQVFGRYVFDRKNRRLVSVSSLPKPIAGHLLAMGTGAGALAPMTVSSDRVPLVSVGLGSGALARRNAAHADPRGPRRGVDPARLGL